MDRRAVDVGPPDGQPERRRRGRPSIPPEQRAKMQTIHVKVPSELHDALCRAALRHNLPVSVVARRALERAFPAPLSE